MNSLASLRVPVCILMLGSLLAVAPAAGQQKKRPAKPAKTAAASTEKAFVEGPPLDLEKLVVLINAKDQTTGKPLVESKTIAEAIRNRKLTFTATDENIDRLKLAGAKEDVIAAVKEVAPAPEKPPEPPKPTLAPLTVNCAPDCSFRVDGGVAEETEAGTARKQLTLGSHTVEVAKAGYVTQSQTVDLAEEGKVLEFALKPDEATRVKIGAAVLNRMLGAVGEESADISGQGSLTWIPTSGAPVEWTISARFTPSFATLTVVSGNLAFEMECKGETCEPHKTGSFFGKRKDMKGPDAARAEQDLRAFRRYYVTGLARMLKPQLTNGRLKAQAESETAVKGVLNLHVESPEDVWEFVLDQAYLPQSVAHFAKAVPGTVIKGTYSDYVAAGNAKLPKRTTVTMPDPKLGAVQVRFDTLQPTSGGK
jgi:hypothetical protein